MNALLTIKNLKVSINKKSILRGVSLSIKPGETHVLMGPNGSGKSTLAQTIFSHPAYKITAGKIYFGKKDITDLLLDKIAKLGVQMAFQNPPSIPGVSITSLLKIASSPNPGGKKEIKLDGFAEKIKKQAMTMQLSEEFLFRSVNEGFSGGEKKKAEVLQLSILKPKLAIFDESDSGLDIDALKLVAQKINELKKAGTSILLITHYQRILKYVKLDFVHMIKDGKIVKSGGKKLAEQIEKKGYRK